MDEENKNLEEDFEFDELDNKIILNDRIYLRWDYRMFMHMYISSFNFVNNRKHKDRKDKRIISYRKFLGIRYLMKSFTKVNRMFTAFAIILKYYRKPLGLL